MEEILEHEFPWPPQGQPVTAAAAATWRGASLEPRTFFGRMPPDRPIGPAVLYYLMLGIVVAGADLFWANALPQMGFDAAAMLGLEEEAGGWSPLIDFLLAPLTLLLSLFLAAGVTHVLLKLFGGANEGFGTTTRVFAYAYSPQLLGIIPFLGMLAGFVWMVVVAIIGLAAAHRTSTGRAAAAVLVPVGVLLFMLAVFAFIAAAGGLILA